MTIKKNALIFLLGAVFLFAGIVLKQYGVSKTSTYPDKKQYLESVLQNVNGALKNSENHARQILSKLEQGKGVIYFDILKTRQPFPLFIHQADSLVFWSDYQYSIPEKILKEDKKYDFLDIDAGKFIILRINGENNLKVSVLLPLFRDYQIQNQFLEPNHNEDFFKNENLKVFKGEESDAFTISTKGGKYLFSISFIQDEISNPRIVGLSFICIVLFIVLSVISLYQFNNHAGKLNKGVLVFITISGIITLRLILLYFSFPEAWLDMELFNPEHYASSVLNASLGDLLLNILTALVCAVILLNNYQNKTFIQRITGLRSISIPVIILLNVALFFVFADAMYSLYRHSLHSFDITDNISLNQFKLWYLIIFCLFSAGYFILNHILVRLFVLLSDNKKRVYIISLILFVLAGLLLNILYELPFYLFLLHAVFVTVVLFFRLYNTLRAYSYRAYIYFITCAVFTAFSASFLVMENRTEMDYQKKRKFAEYLLTENDLQGEFLLNEAIQKIKNDLFIKNIFLNPLTPKRLIAQKVKRIYLGSYFDKYDVNIGLYDNFGNPYLRDDIRVNFQNLYIRYARKEFETEFPNIYLIKGYRQNIENKYLAFIKIQRSGIRLGYIVLELNLKKIIPTSVYPKLLVDNKYLNTAIDQNYNYAVYVNDNLRYSHGNYDYGNELQYALKNTDDTDNTYYKSGYRHTVINQDAGQVLIVSNIMNLEKQVFTNFSFLFLCQVFLILVGLISTAILFQVTRRRLNFSTRLQIVLNVGYFLPLLLVSAATLGAISSNYRNEQEKNYSSKADRVAEMLYEYIEPLNKRKVSKEVLTSSFLGISKLVEADINLYDPSGHLLISSQPIIFEKDIISELINPKALSLLKGRQEQSTTLKESIGDLDYNAVYVTLEDIETRQKLGILNVPFFNSAEKLNQRLADVLSIILNIFSIIFLILMVVSFFMSKALLAPLVLMTKNLKRISFKGLNERLKWESGDEIGLLIREYNNMLVKLEQSKRELAIREKEHAWREMAQQVAHEIKNPLTPMKLTLQHMIIRTEKEGENDITKKVKVLLEQVETLDDIATSFSTFAKMPAPDMQPFQLDAVVKNSVALYNTHDNVDVNLEIGDQPLEVQGDPKLMGRIITNLILNGIQAVPDERKPVVDICLDRDEDYALLKINDNGTGIPEDIQPKVFIPNFSTKYAGSGIGLAVAKKGISDFGGKIWFETVPDEGTTFYIKLPLIGSWVKNTT